jgi:hypothetical protein
MAQDICKTDQAKFLTTYLTEPWWPLLQFTAGKYLKSLSCHQEVSFTFEHML